MSEVFDVESALEAGRKEASEGSDKGSEGRHDQDMYLERSVGNVGRGVTQLRKVSNRAIHG